MSDDEREYSGSEEEQEQVVQKKEAEPPKISEAEMAMEEKLKKKKEEEEQMWQEYLEQRKKQRQKEEEDLRKLKERQARRKTQRQEQEKKLSEMRRKQEEQRVREMEEKKAKEAEAKKKRLEEAERKRQAMQEALQKRKDEPIQRNFVIQKRDDGGLGTGLDKVMIGRGEMTKTREQLEEEKKLALSIRVKPLNIEALSVQELRQKAQELWEKLVCLESEKYDLEERKKRQDYDLKELSERQRQINRNKALKKGLDPDALQGKYPPKIQVASKYERRIDRRTFSDKKGLFEGGIEAQNEEYMSKNWEERMNAFKERGESKLPKWDPSNPKTKETHDARHEIEEEEELELEPPPTFGEPEPSPPRDTHKEEEEEEEGLRFVSFCDLKNALRGRLSVSCFRWQ